MFNPLTRQAPMDPLQISRESIFISAIRSFCNAFFAILGIFVCLFIALFFWSGGQEDTSLSIKPDAEGNKTLLPSSSPVVLKLSIDGIIGTGQLVTSAIETILSDSRSGPLNH
ncbi:MAG: hypothetical protein FJZ63_06005, partial [Chlamydiae bacterium]|nr:hypothetical protein [Chlamydiota bacterium]